MAILPRISYVAHMGFVDHATRHSSIRFNVLAAAFTAWLTDTSAGSVRDTFDAIHGLTVDTVELERVSERGDATTTSVVPPASEAAVNSAKLIALLVDNVNQSKFSMQIPARDTTAYTSTRGLVDINPATRTAAVDAFITAVNANVRSEDGNSSTVYEVRVIGKGSAA